MKTKQIYRVAFTAALCLSATLFASAQAVTAYVTVIDQKSGTIKGDVTTKGLEGKIECDGFSYSVLSPRDPSSGLPSGKKQEKPVTLLLPFDSSTPLLLQSLYTNENLTSVTIQFFKASATGPAALCTIKLTNASISEMDQSIDKTSTTAADKTLSAKVSFTFQKIEITNSTGNAGASDNWTN